MVKIYCCDDNEATLELLYDMLSAFATTNGIDLNVVAYASGIKLLQDISEGDCADIYILDIMMPEINGMDLARTIRKSDVKGKIIFLTGSSDYAVESYDVNAYYYMLKPFDHSKFFDVIIGAIDDVDKTANICIKSKDGTAYIRLDNLMYVDLDSRRLTYHLSDGSLVQSPTLRIPFREAMSALIEKDNFALCSAGSIVNLDYVKAFENESIILEDGTVIYPVRAYYPLVKSAWTEQRQVRDLY